MTNTPKGKAANEKGKTREVVIERQNNSSLYAARFVGGGQLPKELDGALFTSISLAQNAVDNYLNNK